MDGWTDDEVKTILPLPFWVAILVFIFCWPTMAGAEPLFAAEAEGIRIVLYDEPCALKEVSNLPYKATRTEKGKTFSGCWTVNREAGVVVSYFVEDRSVAAIPMGAFKRVTGV